MRKTYITNMPDQAGAFLTATRVITEAGGNIVRVNYNRAVDTHPLRIEVDATEEQQEVISKRLEEVKYLVDDPGMRQIILIELVLPDRPGSLLPTLEIIKNHEVNIPYINSQENGTPYQNFTRTSRWACSWRTPPRSRTCSTTCRNTARCACWTTSPPTACSTPRSST